MIFARVTRANERHSDGKVSVKKLAAKGSKEAEQDGPEQKTLK